MQSIWRKNGTWCIVLPFLFALMLSYDSYGQRHDKKALESIYLKRSNLLMQEEQEVNSYLEKNKIDSRIIDLGNGKRAYLKRITEDGRPEYMAIFNEQSRLTTNVERVQSETGLGIQMYGEGVTVGVWDGGQVLKSHQELVGRVNNKNGAEFSSHATHVAGTIAASGVDPKAKGMAPEVNVIAYYAFEDDLTTMALEAADGLILSNHSYGLVLGWSYNSSSSSWEWYGDENGEDGRFGNYSNSSSTIDDIVYNAPYYTIVWAAGNDRGDVGDGRYPEDGPFGVVTPSGCSKNVITVGAITGFDEYTDQFSAKMSDFSSWGPTSDGRIKPDLVADGVSVYSALANGTGAYGVLSGTSMATPSVTGSLSIVQQYYKSLEGTYMKAASLKALAIHTAREAGANAGPDTQFGWGVLNVADAIEVVQGRNSLDTLMVENNLIEGGKKYFEILSDGKTPIKATLVWTDPSGNPQPIGNTDKVLVNDLDLRVYNAVGESYLPWTINPSNTTKAVKQDDSRNNVEVVEILNPEVGKYLVEVSHKGVLQSGAQEFALVLTGESMAKVGSQEYYWVGGAASMTSSDSWALSSGGEAIDGVQLEDNTLIIDSNSSLVTNDLVTINTDLRLHNLIWSDANEGVSLDLGGNTLTITGSIRSTSGAWKITNGKVVLMPESNGEIECQFVGENLELKIASDYQHSFSSDIDFSRMQLERGDFSIEGKNINLNELSVGVEVSLHLLNNEMSLEGASTFLSSNVSSSGNTWNVINGSVSFLNVISYDDDFTFEGDCELIGISSMKTVSVKDKLTIDGQIHLDTLNLMESSDLIMTESDTIILDRLLVFSSEADRVSITGGVLSFATRRKYCFDFMDVSDLTVMGESVVNAGINSTVIDSENIYSEDCAAILFADFMVSGNCTNSAIYVTDESSGDSGNYEWDFGGLELIGELDQDYILLATEAGQYNVTLKLTSDINETVFTKTIEIQSNDQLIDLSVIANNQGLVSTKSSEIYYWYLDGQEITGANDRILPFPLESGEYRVAIVNNETACSTLISEPYIHEVLGVKSRLSINVYPNPVVDRLIINNAYDVERIEVYSLTGIRVKVMDVNSGANLVSINLEGLTKGVYVVSLIGKGEVENFKIVKNEN